MAGCHMHMLPSLKMEMNIPLLYKSMEYQQGKILALWNLSANGLVSCIVLRLTPIFFLKMKLGTRDQNILLS